MNVSVVVPSYNRADFLERTIASVINQGVHDLEIIIVDDASLDNTQVIIENLSLKWPHYNIKYVKHKINKGESGARNTGINEASGKYIAFLDSDDEWLPGKLQSQLVYMEKNKSDGVVCEYYYVERDALRHHLQFKEDSLSSRDLLTKGCGFGIGTNLLIKRSSIAQKFDENLKLFADIDWLYRVLKEYSIGVIHRPLSLYHKAPMRSGGYIKQHADVFLRKYKDEILSFPVRDRILSFSTMNWYVAIAYYENKEFKKSLPYYLLGILQNPFRRIGNYIHILDLFLKIIFNKP